MTYSSMFERLLSKYLSIAPKSVTMKLLVTLLLSNSSTSKSKPFTTSTSSCPIFTPIWFFVTLLYFKYSFTIFRNSSSQLYRTLISSFNLTFLPVISKSISIYSVYIWEILFSIILSNLVCFKSFSSNSISHIKRSPLVYMFLYSFLLMPFCTTLNIIARSFSDFYSATLESLHTEISAFKASRSGAEYLSSPEFCLYIS